MNRLERAIDQLSPPFGASLRLLKKRLHRDPTLAVIDRLVEPGDSVVDVGAYRGVYTLELAKRVGEKGRVWAIEAFPPNAAAVDRVTRRRSNVTVCQCAASDRVGTHEIAVPVYKGHALGALASLGDVPTDNATMTIDLRTIDGLLGDGDRTPHGVTFIRCDVVGSEAAALAGADRTLREHKPSLLVSIEQRHQHTPIGETLERLAGYGYRGYFVRRRCLLPLASFDVHRDQMAFVTGEFMPYGWPPGYVHYFLFVRPDVDVRGLGWCGDGEKVTPRTSTRRARR